MRASVSPLPTVVDKTEATALYEKLKQAPYATVETIVRKETKQEPPLLYDLTTLQKEANSRFGYSAEQTLSLAQKLYEKAYITYPRTGSRYIPERCLCRNTCPDSLFTRPSRLGVSMPAD